MITQAEAACSLEKINFQKIVGISSGDCFESTFNSCVEWKLKQTLPEEFQGSNITRWEENIYIRLWAWCRLNCKIR